MQFVVIMRSGTAYRIDAAYVEVVNGPTSSSYTLLGAVPGYAAAILAAFPTELVVSVLPAAHATPVRAAAPAEDVPPRSDADDDDAASSAPQTGPMADERASSSLRDGPVFHDEVD